MLIPRTSAINGKKYPKPQTRNLPSCSLSAQIVAASEGPTFARVLFPKDSLMTSWIHRVLSWLIHVLAVILEGTVALLVGATFAPAFVGFGTGQIGLFSSNRTRWSLAGSTNGGSDTTGGLAIFGLPGSIARLLGRSCRDPTRHQQSLSSDLRNANIEITKLAGRGSRRARDCP